jgi:predicted small secreted protein
MKNKFGLALTVAALMLGGASLTACNTVEGAGQDIEYAGESVQDAAN